MTTIAYKDGILAVDTQITDLGMVRTDVRKLYVFPGLGAIAFCGTGLCYDNVARWIFNGCRGEKPFSPNPEMTWSAYYVTLGGLIFRACSDVDLQVLEKNKFESDGSGGVIARTAMHLGLSSFDALKTACQLDPHTCGPISWFDANTGKYENAIVMTLDDLKPVSDYLPVSPKLTIEG